MATARLISPTRRLSHPLVTSSPRRVHSSKRLPSDAANDFLADCLAPVGDLTEAPRHLLENTGLHGGRSPPLTRPMALRRAPRTLSARFASQRAFAMRSCAHSAVSHEARLCVDVRPLAVAVGLAWRVSVFALEWATRVRGDRTPTKPVVEESLAAVLGLGIARFARG